MPKTRLSTLCRMNEPKLRAWLRRVWDVEYPHQVSAYYDEWESRLWSHVAFRKDDSGTVEREQYLCVRNLSRRATCTILGAPPFQAIRP